MNEQPPVPPSQGQDHPGQPGFSAPDAPGAPDERPAPDGWHKPQQQGQTGWPPAPQVQPGSAQHQQQHLPVPRDPWQQAPAAWRTSGPPDALEPRTYPQLLRGPKHTWWRPLVSTAVVAGLSLAVLILMVVAMFAGLVLSGQELQSLSGDEDAVMEALAAEPWFLLLNNLMLAAGIPVAMVAVWVGHGWRPRWVNSVQPRIRWRWLVVSCGVALVVQVVATAGYFAVLGYPQGRGEDVVLLLAIVFLTTPLQAAGEEYFFRGWMTQALGSWFRGAMASALVPALITALAFAAAHGLGQNIWLFLDRFAFGLVASYLTWRTGGLEAAIGVHTVNNVVVFVPVILSGTLAEALVPTDAPWYIFVLDVVVMVVISALLVLLARRMALARRHDPAKQPGAQAPTEQPTWAARPLQQAPVLVPPRQTG